MSNTLGFAKSFVGNKPGKRKNKPSKRKNKPKQKIKRKDPTTGSLTKDVLRLNRMVSKLGRDLNKFVAYNFVTDATSKKLLETHQTIAASIAFLVDEQTATFESLKEEEKNALAISAARAEEKQLETDKDEEDKEITKEDLKKKKKKGGIFSFIDDLVSNTLEGFIGFLIDFAAFKALQWMANPDNTERLKSFVDLMIPFLKGLNSFANFAMSTGFGIASDIGKIFEDDSSFWEKVKGYGWLGLLITGTGLVAKVVGTLVSLINPFNWPGLAMGGLKNVLKTINFAGSTVNFFRTLPQRVSLYTKRTANDFGLIKRTVGDIVGPIKNGILRGLKATKNSLDDFFKTGLGPLLKRTSTFLDDAFLPAKGLIGRLFSRIGLGGVKNFLGGFVRVLSKVPFISAIIDFCINKFVLRLPADESAFYAGGALLGGIIGSAAGAGIAGYFSFGVASPLGGLVGKIVGGIAGDLLARLAWKLINATPKKKDGGIVDKPTLALVGEAGKEYIVPEAQFGGMEGDSASVLIGSTEAFVTALRGSLGPMSSDIANMISPLKREFGSQNYVYPKISGANIDTKSKTNLLGLTELETKEFRRILEDIESGFTRKNVKEGTSLSASSIADTTEKGFASSFSGTAGGTASISGSNASASSEIKMGFGQRLVNGIKNFFSGNNEKPMDTVTQIGSLTNMGITGASPSFVNPAPKNTVLTSGWGAARSKNRKHTGIDLAGPTGTPIYAAASGEVIFSGWDDGGYGNMIKIKHSDGTITAYGHNNKNHVETGMMVRQGQKIADMGSTGFSTGPHLHFEIIKNGQRIDPTFVVDKTAGTYSDAVSSTFSNMHDDTETTTVNYDDIAKAFRNVARKLGFYDKSERELAMEKNINKIKEGQTVEGEADASTTNIAIEQTITNLENNIAGINNYTPTKTSAPVGNRSLQTSLTEFR